MQGLLSGCSLAAGYIRSLRRPLLVTRLVDFGYDIEQALEAPRWLVRGIP